MTKGDEQSSLFGHFRKVAYLEEKQEITVSYQGNVRIKEDVLSALAAHITLQVEGVVGMSSNVVDGVSRLLGMKTPNQGIQLLDKTDTTVAYTIYVTVAYGYRIPDIALRIQESVKTYVQEMTNYKVTKVNVSIQDIDYSREIPVIVRSEED